MATNNMVTHLAEFTPIAEVSPHQAPVQLGVRTYGDIRPLLEVAVIDHTLAADGKPETLHALLRTTHQGEETTVHVTSVVLRSGETAVLGELDSPEPLLTIVEGAGPSAAAEAALTCSGDTLGILTKPDSNIGKITLATYDDAPPETVVLITPDPVFDIDKALARDPNRIPPVRVEPGEPLLAMVEGWDDLVYVRMATSPYSGPVTAHLPRKRAVELFGEEIVSQPGWGELVPTGDGTTYIPKQNHMDFRDQYLPAVPLAGDTPRPQ